MLVSWLLPNAATGLHCSLVVVTRLRPITRMDGNTVLALVSQESPTAKVGIQLSPKEGIVL